MMLSRPFRALKNQVCDITATFARGNWAVKTSFFIFGFGNLYYGQIGRGLLFLLFQIVFIAYMLLPSGGIHWLQKSQWFQTGKTVGTVAPTESYNEVYDVFTTVYGDDSVKVLLYALLTLLFIFAYLWTWRLQLRQCRLCMDITAQGKGLNTARQDLKSLLDENFHKSLLALPLAGILFFTVLPILYMILIAFTSYDAQHDGFANLFSWVGLRNFNQLLNVGSGGMGLAFGEILSWTLMWAFFATFTNYFLGMLLAMAINKKGIRFKKFWRSVLVTTIAVPQFVSLMLLSKMLADTGVVNRLLMSWGWIAKPIPFLSDGNLARVTVILVNLWVGVPYTVLICTGILLNIPADLYEAARIDGAGPITAYFKITLPYMLHITTPYLISQFIANFNNFNVIFLLTGGTPLSLDYMYAGKTDLLITWLYKLTFNESNYKLAAVISIFVFFIVATVSLIVYNRAGAVRSEEEFG